MWGGEVLLVASLWPQRFPVLVHWVLAYPAAHGISLAHATNLSSSAIDDRELPRPASVLPTGMRKLISDVSPCIYPAPVRYPAPAGVPVPALHLRRRSVPSTANKLVVLKGRC